MSWGDLAAELRSLASRLRFARIAAARPASIKRTIARWEAGEHPPDERYRVLLAHLYARTPLGAVALGPGSDFQELPAALSSLGVDRDRLDESASFTAAAVTESGTSLLAFLGTRPRRHLAAALARPETVDLPLLDELDAATAAVDAQVGSVPFVRLHLSHAAVVDACRRLPAGEQPPTVRARLRRVAGTAYALAARPAFETHDDGAALALYEQAVSTTCGADPSRRALIRTGQTMVVYYATGDIARARRLADAAVADACSGPSRLVRARAHALQAETAARSTPPLHRHARAALRLAWCDLDTDTSDDPMGGTFSKGRPEGFEGVCGLFLGEAEAAEERLGRAARALGGVAGKRPARESCRPTGRRPRCVPEVRGRRRRRPDGCTSALSSRPPRGAGCPRGGCGRRGKSCGRGGPSRSSPNSTTTSTRPSSGCPARVDGSDDSGGVVILGRGSVGRCGELRWGLSSGCGCVG